MCYPDKLTKEDMINFDKKCFALTRYNINEKNVNSKLNKLTILNMPDAGIDLKDWLVEDGKITKDKMYILNELVVKLLKKQESSIAEVFPAISLVNCVSHLKHNGYRLLYLELDR